MKFKYNRCGIVHNCLVVTDNNVSLLGRDLCAKLQIKVEIPVENMFSLKNEVANKYKDYLSDEFLAKGKVKFTYQNRCNFCLYNFFHRKLTIF